MTKASRHRERRLAIGGARAGSAGAGQRDLRVERERDVAAHLTGIPGWRLSTAEVRRIIKAART